MSEWLSDYSQGCYIDAKDNTKSWCVSKILAIDHNQSVRVRYDGWSDKWDNTFYLPCSSIAPFRSHSELYTGQKNQAVREWYFSHQELTEITSQLAEPLIDAFSVTQLLRGHLFTLVDNLLVCEYRHPKDLDIVVRFFIEVLRFIVGWMKELPGLIAEWLENPENFLSNSRVATVAAWPELLFTLRRLLGLDLRTSRNLMNWKFIPQDYTFVPPTAYKNNTLSFLVNFFASIGGFDVVLQIVSGEINRAPIRLISALPVFEIRSYFSRSFDEKWSHLFKVAMVARINAIDNKEIKIIEKNSISVLVGKLKLMFGCYEENWDLIELEVMLKALQSPFLDKKIKSVIEIKEAIDSLGLEKGISLRHEQFAQWICKKNILEVILENPHEELIKRIGSICVFLCGFKLLKFEALEALMKYSQGTHNSLQPAAYQVILQITPHLPQDTKESLYKLIIEKPLENVNPEYIKFLYEFTIKAYSKECKNLYGLDALYKMSKDSGKSKIHELALEGLVNVLKHTKIQQQIIFYLKKAVNNVTKNKSICQSILIILQIMNNPYGSYMSAPQKEDLFKYLESMVTDFSSFVSKHCTEILNGNKMSVFSTTKSIKICLKMWKFIIKSRHFEVSIEEIKHIKDATMKNPDKKPYLKFMKALLKMVKNEFSPATNFSILNEMFLKPQPEMSIQSFEVFYELFLKVNCNKKSLDINSYGLLSRNVSKLLGFDVLISCYFCSDDENIMKKSMKLLMSLTTKIHRNLLSAKQEIWEDFFRILHGFLDPKKPPEQTKRAIQMITQFLETNVRKEDHPPNSMIRFKLMPESEAHTIHVNDKQATIGTIRKKIADIYKKPVGSALLLHQNERFDYLSDDIPLEVLKQPWNFTVDFIQNPDTLTLYQFINNCYYILDSLFRNISEFSHENADLSWEILQKCSIIESRKASIESFLLPFSEIFSSDCLYRLVYSLKIVETLLKISDWLETFKSNEGIEYIISCYISFDSEKPYSDSLTLEYNSKIISIISEIANQASSLPNSLTPKILNSLIQAASICNESETSADIARNAKEILNAIKIKDTKSYYAQFLEYSMHDLMQACFIKCRCKFFSSTMSSFFLELSSSMPLLSKVFLKELFGIIELALVETHNESFWSLLCFYIEEAADEGLEERYLKVLGMLEGYKAESAFGEVSQTLSGLIKVITTFIGKGVKVSEEAVELVLNKCLFEVPSQTSKDAPKCKKRPTRKDAFDLLREMCRRSEKAQEKVINYLSYQYKDPSWRTFRSADWNYHPNALEKSFTGYVGIKNLGCICYMISSLQQLFTILDFRESILRIVTEEGEENLLYQLQHAFSALKYSEKQFINPKGLCKAFKTWEGQSVNVHEQMDADEFINTFMDRLGSQLSGKSPVTSLFTGYLVTEIIGKNDCTHRSEVLEAFITLPVQVKNKKSLQESLDCFINGEVMQDTNAYQCDHCDSKVTAIRRVCIKYLPNILFITLRRFEFDYDLMKRMKLNDFCEFPMELNMEKYSQEGLDKLEKPKEAKNINESDVSVEANFPSSYYEYKLRGIIIHSGTADSGHYYSYIKQNNEWLEFNDTIITPFNPSDIPQEAFGGNEKLKDTSSFTSQPKLRNAYILIYERASLFSYNQLQNSITTLEYTHLPQELEFSDVKSENEKFWRCKSSFSSEYFDFVLQMLQETNESLCKFGICIFFTVIIRSRDYHRIASCAMCLKEHLKNSQDLCEWLLMLVSYVSIIKELFLDCPVVEKRRIMVVVVTQALRSASSECRTIFLYKILQMLPIARRPYSVNFAQYFELIYRAIKLQPEMVKVFEVHLRLYEYLMGVDIKIENEKYEEKPPEEGFLGYECLTQGLDRNDLCQTDSDGSMLYLIHSLKLCYIYFNYDQIATLLSEPVLNIMIKECRTKAGAKVLGVFYALLCSNDKIFSIKFGKYLVSCIETSVFEVHKLYMRPLYWLLYNPDDTLPEKIEYIMQSYMAMLSNICISLPEAESCLYFLIKLSIKLPKIKDWLARHLKDFNAIESKLNNALYKVQHLPKELASVKSVLSKLDVLRRVLRNNLVFKDYEDSDNDMIDENPAPGSEVMYFDSNFNTWVKYFITVCIGEVICIKSEKENNYRWLDVHNENLRKVNEKDH